MTGPGLYANIHAKRKRGGKMRKKGAKGAPKSSDFARAARTAKKDGGTTKLPRPTTSPGRQKEIKFKDEKMKKMLGNIGKLISKAPRNAKATGRKKFKKGGFPDFSGDGKITRKDILMGQGAIPKPKKKMKRGGLSRPKRVDNVPAKMIKKPVDLKKVKPAMKRGGMAKKKRIKKK